MKIVRGHSQKSAGIVTLLLASILSGCGTVDTPHHPAGQISASSQSATQVARKTVLHRDPAAISLYAPDKALPASYRVVGEAVVSRYSPVGIRRQKAIIHDHLRMLAASMGGDAIINIRKNKKYVQGTVISMPGKRGNITL